LGQVSQIMRDEAFNPESLVVLAGEEVNYQRKLRTKDRGGYVVTVNEF